jgi:hypothetical protein
VRPNRHSSKFRDPIMSYTRFPISPIARWEQLAAGLALLAAQTGCSGSDRESEPVSQAQFPDQFANVWCEAIAGCCSAAQVGYDSATCRVGARNFAANLLERSAGRDATYSPTAGRQCLDRLAHALSSCKLEDAGNACSMIFSGSSREGTPCANGSECTSGYCALGEAGLSGVCAELDYRAPSHGKAGDPCVGSCGVPGSFECPTSLLPNALGTTSYCYAEDGVYCTFDPELLDTLSCQPYAAIGNACGANDVRCIPGAFCADAVCVEQTAAGSCSDTPDQCAIQSFCDSSQECRAKKPISGACFYGEECVSNSCSSADGEAEGVCDLGSALLARACEGVP